MLSVGLIPSNPLLIALGVKIHPKTGGPMTDEMLQTSFPGIFSCGNSLHVHDLVDFVSMEGETAGKAAAEFILHQSRFSQKDHFDDFAEQNNYNVNLHDDGNSGQKKQGNIIETQPLDGIGYVLPSIIHLDRSEEFLLKFRVTRPFKDVFISIGQNGGEIRKIRKPFLIPAEMENIKLKRSELTSDSGILTLEVIHD